MKEQAGMTGEVFGHYRILEKLGSGGMGVVYKAEDTKLGRLVALKFLPPEMSRDPQALARFKREARAASALNHPHICTIYDVDEHQGRQYIVMELLEGNTLKDLIAGTPMTTEQVARLGVQLTEALDAAHSKGIIHRDMKPANVFVSDHGQLKVLDFGLAKLMPGSGGETMSMSLTEAGSTLGTLPYMAPEQVRAQNADGRTDIYALGCILYEMATGKRPFQEDVPARLTDEILHKAPTPPGRLNPNLPPEFERVILKCLEKDPENRYQAAREVAVDLRRYAGLTPASPSETLSRRSSTRWAGPTKLLASTAALFAAIALLIGLDAGGIRSRLLDGSMRRIESLAVLPLDNLSRNPEQDYFADGMTEALIAELSKIRALKVISRTSVMQYKGAKKLLLPQIARELDVDGVIEGSVMRDGTQVRITVQLIDGRTDRHLWTDSYQREMQSILALQSGVAQAIAEQIRVAVSPEERARLARSRSVNPEAYESYLKGRHFWELRTREGLQMSLGYFERAVQIDSQYALGYEGLADAYFILGDNRFLPTRETAPKAKVAVRKALDLDDSLAEAHATQASLLQFFDWDWNGAAREFKRALELNPGYATAHHWYSQYLTSMGRHDEAIAEMELARKLDPLSPRINANLGAAYFFARRNDQAIQKLQNAVALSPDHALSHAHMATAYSEKGMHEEAIAEAQRAIEIGEPQGKLYLARILARAGKLEEARAMIEKTLLSKQEYVSSDSLCVAYAALGETGKALNALGKAYEERSTGIVNMLVEPGFDPLRKDPRFKDLLRRMKFPD
jgi:serine/threonine protein kinase/Tfp pilus assembly protein PilF